MSRPAAPPRQRWWVDGRTWDRERVIDACRRWAQQTGSPPSYYDWSPVQRGRQAGRPSPLAEKWEREHPAWPSVAVVNRHLGGWRAMLLEAGFPAPAPIELSFSERVAQAARLRNEGLRWREIGELLGISPDTARRYPHARLCPVCQHETILRGERCHSCWSSGRTRWGERFERADIIAAIQHWAALEGRAPAAIDWEPADRDGHPRWEQECPRYPPHSHVIRAFGSWNQALQAAGYDRPRPPAYTDQQMLDGPA